MLRPEGKRAGFTILEMVIVLAVIGTVAAMAMPSIVGSVWQQRQSGAAQDLVRFVRGVRDMTRRSGVAHNMVWRNNGNSLGTLEVWMGMNNRCRLTDWSYARSNPGQGHRSVMRFDMARYNPFSGTATPEPGDPIDVLVMRVRTVLFRDASGGRLVNPPEVAAQDTGEICFEPSGDSFLRQPSVVSSDVAAAWMEYQSQLVQFAIQRIAANSTTSTVGVDRMVILAPNGVARVQR